MSNILTWPGMEVLFKKVIFQQRLEGDQSGCAGGASLHRKQPDCPWHVLGRSIRNILGDGIRKIMRKSPCRILLAV